MAWCLVKAQRNLLYYYTMVNFSLCLTKYHAIKTYGGVEVQVHAFLTSVLD